jgi:Uma2 family endonuclease
MSTSITQPITPESPRQATPAPLRPIPDLDELREWTAQPDHRFLIPGVDWAFYSGLVDSLPEACHLHLDFDGRDLEVMSPGPYHDRDKKLLGQLIEAIAQELNVPYNAMGSTTWKRPELKRGLESDESYYFGAEKLAIVAAAIASGSNEIADYPNPDLSVEVDISPSKVDRAGIYAALRVSEIWRLDGERDEIVIERLQENGSYLAVDQSGMLPISQTEVQRWVMDEDSSDNSSWARRLRAWVRTELAPRISR